MGIQERKERHKEDLKQTILNAAKELFLTEGYEATSIRKIAARIEFSPTTIYLYYKDKSDIAHALHCEGFLMLNAQFAVLQHVAHPFERLKAMGRLYIQFALENKDFYELMFIMKEPIQYLDNHCMDESWEEGTNAYMTLVQTIQACQGIGYFSKMDAHSMSLMVWATMHGMCTMKLHGHFDHVVTNKNIGMNPEQTFEATYQTFIQTLEQLK